MNFIANTKQHQANTNGDPVKSASYWCNTPLGWVWCTWDGQDWTLDTHPTYKIMVFEWDKDI